MAKINFNNNIDLLQKKEILVFVPFLTFSTDSLGVV